MKNQFAPLSGMTTLLKKSLIPVFAVLCFVLVGTSANAQFAVTTNSGSGLAPTYTSLANAITALNAATITSPVVITCPNGTETAPAGGYSITAQGTAVNTIIITGNGAANSIITAGVGVSTTLDAIFKLIGADYITIQGFALTDANGTATAQAEFGFALFHATVSNGCQNNTIQNNSITLNKTNLNTWGIYSNNNHSATTIGTTEGVTNNTTGPASGNKVYGNTISNVNMGIAFIGTSTTANQDIGNDVGGSSAGTGNIITNWGGAAASSSYISNSGTSYCIYLNHEVGENVSYNTLTSATISGTSVTLRGIFKDYGTGATLVGTTNITNNTVTITDNFTTGTLECIRTQGTVASTSTLNDNNNTILNTSVGGASSSTTIVGIVNSSAWGTLNMNNNIVRGTTSTATTGGFTGVSNTGAIVTTINMNSNQIGNASGGAITFSAATSGTILGVSNTGGAITSSLSMSSNDFRGIVHSVAGSSAHTYLNQTATGPATVINSNTFTNLNINTTGNVTFITNSVTHTASTVHACNSNSIVTAFNKGGAGGTVQFFLSNGSSSSSVTETCNLNNFSNVTVTGATTIAGFQSTDGGSPTTNVTNNTFNNITGGTSPVTILAVGFSGNGTITGNAISNITGGGAIIGLLTSSGIQSISGNTISTVSTSGASLIIGLSVTAGTIQNIFKNKIYDLSGSNAGSTINGFLVSGGTTVNLYNNLIGDLRATAATVTSPASAVIGINLTSTTTSSNLNVYYNSVYMTGTGGTNFGTTGIFHAASSTSTTATLNLRNNMIVNNCTASGTGTTVVYRRSVGTAGTLANYSSTSNNNFFYTSSGLYYSDGTSTAASMAAYKAGVFTAGTISPRDGASVSDVVSNSAGTFFQSFTGSSSTFLHLVAGLSTQAESGGAAISGFTDDYDGDTRNVSTPDIGADEFSGVAADLTSPNISYTPLGNAPVGSNQTLTATITDASGVPITGVGLPVLYWKLGMGSYTGVTATSIGSNQYTFTFGSATTMAGDVISYYIVAQDGAGTPNVGAFPSTGASGFTPNPPAASTPPTTPSTFSAVASINGNKTICASGCDFTSLTNTGGIFETINNGVVTANVTIEIAGDLTGETGATALNSFASPFTIIIYPTGSARAITSTTAPAGGFIRLNAADRVTIDGSIGGTGTDRSLTINETNTGTTSAVIWLQNISTDGATNNTIKNLNIVGQSNATTLIGIGMGATGTSSVSVSSLGTNNSNNTIQNNNVSKTQYGVYSQGASTGTKNQGNMISGNLLNTVSPNNIKQGGILVGFENSISISGNTVDGISSSSDCFGIAVGLPSINTSTNSGNEVTNATISKNIIGTVANTGGFGAAGITLASAASGTTIISNNMIYGVGGTATPGDFNGGLILGGGSGSTTQVYYNSISMTGTFGSGSSPIFAIAVIASNPVIDIRNNIFYNTQTTTSGKKYAIGLGYPSPYTNLTINRNDYFTSTLGTAGSFATSASANSLSTPVDAITLAGFITATSGSIGNDANSISGDPKFLSNTDLHINTVLTTPVESAGTTIAGITSDYDGDTRNVTTPDIGADEGTFIAPVTNDIQATAFIDPTNPGSKLTGASFSPMASFTNNGTATQTSVTVRYRIIDATLMEIYNQTATIASIASGVTTTVTFPSTSIAIAGTYTIKAKAELAGDAVPANDEITGTLIVESPLCGTKLIGASQAVGYQNLTQAIGKLNSLGVTCAVIFELQADYSSAGETFPLTIIPYGGASATNTFTIKPASGVTASISGTSTSGIFVINGADYVTINGTNSTNVNTVCNPTTFAASRDLTITNTNTGTSTSVVWLQTATADGATNNTVMNCNIVGSGNTQTLFGIGSGSSTISTSSVGTGNNNNSFINNNISKTQYGIFSQGASAANKNTGTIINQNVMNTVSPNNIQIGGIRIGFESGIVISGNNIGGLSGSSTSVGIGLGLYPSNTYTSFTGNEVTGATVSKNIINDIVRNGDGTSIGISISAVTTAASVANTLSNNMISGVRTTSATPSDFPAGILVGGGAQGSTNVYYNTIALTGLGSSSSPGFGIAIGGTNPVVDVRNNIFVNKMTSTSGKMYAIGLGYSTPYTNLTSNNNDFFTTASPLAVIGGFGNTPAGDQANLAAWQTTTGKDGLSLNIDPVFLAPNLHIDVTNAINYPLNNAAVTIAAVTDDIDCNLRATDIGADEFCVPPTVLTYSSNPAIYCQDVAITNNIPTVNGDPTFIYSVTPSLPPGLTLNTTTGVISGTPTMGTAMATYTVMAMNACGNTTAGVVITVGATPGTPMITATESTCQAGCTVGGGSFNVTTACGPGTTLTYYTSMAGTTTTGAPTYNQTTPMTIYYACVDDVTGCRSAI
ncbi:MAG: hypothetical protein ABJB16_06680, partial [Saprospiraceae bacterium]